MKIFDSVLFIIIKIEVFPRTLTHVRAKSDLPSVSYRPPDLGCSGKNALFAAITFFKHILAMPTNLAQIWHEDTVIEDIMRLRTVGERGRLGSACDWPTLTKGAELMFL